MKIFLSIILLSLNVYGESPHPNQKVENLDSVLHENSGCPIFSNCSKESGIKIGQWENFIKKLPQVNFEKKLENFRKKNGLPVKFLTNKDSAMAIDPISWNSRCKIHNPKNPHKRILKALSFFKNQPKSKHITLNPVYLFEGKKKIKYEVPYEDIPLMMKNGKLILIKNYDALYYNLAITKAGQWNVQKLDFKERRVAMNYRQKSVPCPESSEQVEFPFNKTYCQKIWDIDQKKLKTIQLFWTCP